MSAVETLEDWNKLLSCCCEMPSCPVPLKICQSKTGSATVDGVAPFLQPAGDTSEPLPLIYQMEAVSTGYVTTGRSAFYESYDTGFIRREDLVVVNFNPDGSTTTTANTSNIYDYATDTCESDDYNGGGNAQPGDVTFDPPVTTYTCTATSQIEAETEIAQSGGTEPTLQGCPVTSTGSTVNWWDFTRTIETGDRLVDGKSLSELIAEAVADIPASWTDPVPGTNCIASVTSTWPTIAEATPEGGWPECADYEAGDVPSIPVDADVTARAVRYRWQIPDTHTGTWFKITWDVYFFPETGDPVMVSEDNVEEWTGPGTGDQDDPSWDAGTWHEIEPPAEPGENRIVNIRFECYRGIYGNLPQTTGEGVELP